ncbi:hypothetical protein LPN01_07625 [Sphingomonas sp. A2-49]|uniref:hypothetical protein n=1 Tax=Sphingomonas sp. A2-49 TaxID=1391375 RepID=UPI0021D2FE47|nr:hypothetical protein [Sphingomonas sp. A2-49]MCU6453943.1 hypothetical protein [Sphingomonas sp. A2-49]
MAILERGPTSAAVCHLQNAIDLLRDDDAAIDDASGAGDRADAPAGAGVGRSLAAT